MRHWTPYLLVAPPVVLLASLVVYPLLYNVSLSLRNYRTGEFVGLHNFARALDDPQFFASLWATAIYVSGTLVVEILLGLPLALLVHRTIRSGWARTLVYLLFLIPMVTPPVAAGVIARLIYSPTYGVQNVLLQRVGLIHTDVLWLAQPFTAMLAVISVDVWQWMPFVFLVCFAGLQAVPLDTAEAARVDGADGWRLFRHIEYPYLRSLLLLVMVFRFTDTFRVFDHVQVLTGGGPGATTEFLRVEFYRFPPTLLPVHATVEPFLSVLFARGYLVLLRNSLVACLTAVTAGMVVAMLIAYPVTRFPVPLAFRRGLMNWILSLRFLPPIVVVIPFFDIVRKLGLYDSLLSLVLLYTVFSLPLATWMLRGFLLEVPMEIEEAALVDGAGRFYAFFKILLPQLAPALLATGVITFALAWSEFMFAFILSATPRSQTFPIGVASLVTQFEIIWNEMAAVGTIAAVVPILLLLFARRYVLVALTFGVVREKA